MKPVLLSIVIPSYNGAERIINLLKILEEIVPESVKAELEVIISDNQSDPKIQLPEEIGLGNRVKIVSPSMHLLTAEENLLFALQHSNGSYCWILGDDDFPIKNGFQMLLELVQTSEFELMIFNSLAFDVNSNSWDIHRLDLDRLINKMPFVDFVKRAGFWSITAGFSTLAFKRTAFDLSFMQNLHIDGLKIYSHVTTLLKSFHDKSFAAIALPLVKYSSNSFDEESLDSIKRDQHWFNYAEIQNHSYRAPWTVLFLKQIKVLQENSIFSTDELLDVLDQSHLGERFFLFDSILAFVIDQIILQTNDEFLKPLAEDELIFVLNELSGKEPQFDEIIDQVKLAINTTDQQKSLSMLSKSLSSTDEQLRRRKVMTLSSGAVYRSPYGFLWTPFKPNINKNYKSLSSPKGGIVSAENLNDLENKVMMFLIENPFFLYYANSDQINVIALNKIIRHFDRLTSRVPSFIRKRFR